MDREGDQEHKKGIAKQTFFLLSFLFYLND